MARKVKAGTLSIYERHWKRLQRWMEDRGVPPLLECITVFLFIACLDDIMDAGYCYPAANFTRCAVALAYRIAQFDPPYVTDHPSVKAALKGFQRAAANRVTRRCGIGRVMREQLLKVLFPLVPLELWPQVYGAFMVGSEMLLRINEALASLAGHYGFTATAVDLYLPQSKSDQLRHGVSIRSTHPMLVRCMRRLCEGLQPGQRIFTVTAAYLNELIGRGATILGWQGYYSYHSFRHGTASDIWLHTKDLQQVQSAGRWLTKAAARWYIHIIQIPHDVGDDD